MVSTELLRRYPFFSFLTPDQLREVAMIGQTVTLEKGETLFEIGDTAEALYLLLSGSMDLHYMVMDENLPHLKKDFMVGSINPGEVVGISAVIEPHKLTATAQATMPCELLAMDGAELRELAAEDSDLAYGLMKAIARTTMERLYSTRILLAAASTPV